LLQRKVFPFVKVVFFSALLSQIKQMKQMKQNAYFNLFQCNTKHKTIFSAENTKHVFRKQFYLKTDSVEMVRGKIVPSN
jgi:hypothetical protein